MERADTYERGVVGGEGELSASDRGVRAIGWIFDADIHVSLRMIYNNFGDPLTVHLRLSSGQALNLSSTLVYINIYILYIYLFKYLQS